MESMAEKKLLDLEFRIIEQPNGEFDVYDEDGGFIKRYALDDSFELLIELVEEARAKYNSDTGRNNG